MESCRMLRRLTAALAVSCALCATAIAQPARAPPNPNDPRLRPELREPPRGERLIALVPMGTDAAIGLGRFSIAEPPRPRTNIEPERNPADVGRDRRNIGGLGLRIIF